jgi:hypothetical protein
MEFGLLSSADGSLNVTALCEWCLQYILQRSKKGQQKKEKFKKHQKASYQVPPTYSSGPVFDKALCAQNMVTGTHI